MGTIFNIDERLSRFSDLTEDLALDFIQILTENYNAGKLHLGNNLDSNHTQKEAIYTITDSENEAVLFTFKLAKKDNKDEFEIKIASKESNSPSQLIIRADYNLISKLPEKMMSELSDHYFGLVSN